MKLRPELSLYQMRENFRLVDNAMYELAQMDLWNTPFEDKYDEIFNDLDYLRLRIEDSLRKREERCLENMKS